MNETTVTVVGTVCSEIRYSQATDDTPMARFQIRTNPRRFDKRTNTWTDGDPSYYSAACFRTLADHVASSMGVGDPVVATGRLRISRWRRNNETMVSAELDVQAIGHDLRWGTTVYRRTTPPTRIPGPPRPPRDGAGEGAGAGAMAGAGVGAVGAVGTATDTASTATGTDTGADTAEDTQRERGMPIPIAAALAETLSTAAVFTSAESPGLVASSKPAADSPGGAGDTADVVSVTSSATKLPAHRLPPTKPTTDSEPTTEVIDLPVAA